MSHAIKSILFFVGLMLVESTVLADGEFDAPKKLYDTYCVQCHGMSRNGHGINATAMSVAPRDHTDTKAMSDTSDASLFKAIKEGGLSVNKSILMPTWGGVLSDDQIKSLVKYLRFVSKSPKN